MTVSQQPKQTEKTSRKKKSKTPLAKQYIKPQDAPGDIPDIGAEYQWIGVSADSADDERYVGGDDEHLFRGGW